MPRETYVLRDGKLVPKHLAAPLPTSPSLYVISDTMDVTLNPADGRRYDSKRAYERAVRQAGCVIVGNEKLPERRPYEPTGVAQDIKRTMEQMGL